MALQSRNVTAIKENVRLNTKLEVSKISAVSRPALRPICNRNLPARSVTRLVSKTSAGSKTNTSAPPKPSIASTKPVVPVKASITTNHSVRKPEICKLNQDATKSKIAPKATVKASAKPASYSSSLNNVIDIDKDDALNVQLAPPYANDIYAYLRDLEKKYSIRAAYLTGQSINGNMRSLLLNWLVEVHGEFRMFPESLHLTIAILDRFLQDCRTIDRSKLQLVGATCLFIAGKYEELFGPDVCDLVFMSQGAFTKSEITEMECKILSTLDFKLGRPLPIHFLRRFSKAGEAEASHHNLAKYIIELGLLEYSLCHHTPSLLAAASLYLSLWLFSGEKLLSKKLWTDTLVYYSTYKFSEISGLVKSLAVLIVKAETAKYQVLRKKYSASKYMKASANGVLASMQLKKLAAASAKE